MNYGPQPPVNGFRYRVDHPTLGVVLISIAYHLFGVNEWAARLFPVMMAVGVALTSGHLAHQVLNNKWGGLLSVFFCLLSPMMTYYGRMPAPHNMALFFCMFFFVFYWRWFVTQRFRYLLGMWSALILGACTDWVIYFAPVAVFFHYLLFQKSPRKLAFIIALIVSPVLLFGCYVGWTYWQVGNRAILSLWNTFVGRVWSSHGLGKAIDLKVVGKGFYEQFKYWIPPPVLALSLLWFVRLGWKARLREVTAAQGFIMALFVFGFSHDLMFMNLVLVHDFVMLYHLMPAFAVASAAALIWIGEQPLSKKPYIYAFILVTVIVAFTWQMYTVFKSRQSQTTASDIHAYWVGKTLQREVSETGKYIAAVDFLASTGSLRAYVAADREFTQVTTLADFLSLSDNPVYEAIVVANSDLTDPDLRQYLVERYPRSDVAGYSIFDLDHQGSDVLVADPVIEHPYRVQFGSQVAFLGYDIQEVVYRVGKSFGWLDHYLNQHVELEPENKMTLLVVNYWQKLTEDSTNCALLTHFETQDGQFRLERTYSGLDELYPTSLWSVMQVVREEIEIVVPPDYPAQRYEMWVSVKCGSETLPPKETHTIRDGNFRARVGQAYIWDDGTEVSPNLFESAIRRPVNARVANELSLVHFEQSQEAVLPGDILVVTLTWLPYTEIEQNYKVFVHLKDAQGNLVTQHDAEPDRWEQPTSQWTPGIQVQDAHMLLIPRDASAGTYTLYVGMYVPTTMERLVIEDAEDVVRDNAVEIGKVTVLQLEGQK